MNNYLDPDNEELLADFFQEATAQVETLEQNILSLEQNPKDNEAVDELFRAAHTLKGGAATVGLAKLTEVTHLMEDVLDEVRSKKLAVSEDIVDCFLAAIDVIKAILDAKAKGREYKGDTARLEKRLAQFIGGKAGPAAKTLSGAKAEAKTGKKVPPAASKPAGPHKLSEYEILELKEAGHHYAKVLEIKVDFNEDNPMNTVGGIQIFAILKELGTILKTDPEFEKLYQDVYYPTIVYYLGTDEDEAKISKNCRISDVTLGVEINRLSFEAEEEREAGRRADPEETQAAGNAEESQPREEEKAREEDRGRKILGSVLRVDSKRIDQLLNLVSEVVINKAAFNQLSGGLSNNFLQFQLLQEQYRDRIRELFDALPGYLEEIQGGKPLKTVKKDLLAKFGDLLTFFGQYDATIKDLVGRIKSSTQGLARIAGELQEGVMQIRMVPISQIFSRFPRLVRDLSKTLKKQIQLVIQGEDTELDKSVIEDLLDPLIHCVRNSIDHGIEDPETRKKNGKETTGEILLSAANEGNMVVIEVADDGRGIDIQGVRKKAIDSGVIHQNKILSEIEAYSLIFEPGFSTAKKVTDVSGRGVGLDVVKKQIEKLSGTVSVWSDAGRGTRFTIKLPLTLAIIQGLLVRVGKNVFAIPVTSVLETLKVKTDEIRFIDNYEVFNLREDVISLMRLHTLFHIEAPENMETGYIVIVGSKDSRIGILVDGLIGEEDVVIKPLKDRFTRSPGIAGASILGDGTVSLIIDVGQLLELGMRMGMEERRHRQLGAGGEKIQA